ncbi:MAG: glycolate oxidase subunit GlcF [Pseudomonadota bacterium]
MEARLTDAIRASHDGQEAADILRSCVHCGFCTATCPTYQLLGDELDGPRGRIYLIKQVLEGDTPTASTQLHLDRCLTCRACETTCPSGVQFGRLLDIGRRVVDEQVARPFTQRIFRSLLATGLTGPLFAPALRVARTLGLQPPRVGPGQWPTRTHARKMLLLSGCVQPAMAPNINAATARVLDALGIQVHVATGSGCCGAIRHHLTQQQGALADVRRNIDAWWPHVEAGVEAIMINASGCSTMVSEYGHLLRDDPAYAHKALRISALARDLSELLPQHAESLAAITRHAGATRVAYHAPCSLQHGLKVRGLVEKLLMGMGAQLLPVAEGHLCCGSAGTYTLLQPQISRKLGQSKVRALMAPRPDVILSANIGCLAQIAKGADVPVQHWIEWVDARITDRG